LVARFCHWDTLNAGELERFLEITESLRVGRLWLPRAHTFFALGRTNMVRNMATIRHFFYQMPARTEKSMATP
jgi:hypothetical protein